MKTIKKQTNNNGLSQLISKLKTEDNTYANISRAIQIMYWIFIPFFLIMSLLEYNKTGNINELISGAGFLLGFLIFALLFGKYYREYKYVDYSQSTVQMLKQAAYRYQFFQGRMVWVFLALVFVDVGLIFDRMDNVSLIKIQYRFIGAVVFGLFAGLIIWHFKYKPLRDDALRLLREIEG